MEVHKIMKQILKQLYSRCDSSNITEAEVNDYSITQKIGNNNGAEVNLSQSESIRKLKDSIKLSTSLVINQKQDVGFPPLNKELALFKATEFFESSISGIETIPHSNVEAELAFSADDSSSQN